MDELVLIDNVFQGNGPVYSGIERLYSPYLKHLNNFTALSYSEAFRDELGFFEMCLDCLDPNTDELVKTIDLARVKGAVFAENYQTLELNKPNSKQSIRLENCTFEGNDVGPVIDRVE